MASLMPTGKQQFFDSPNGRPLAGGKLYTYAAGTTTPKATYSDSAGTIPNPNPIVLDARGEALIYWTGSYDIVLKDANDNLIYSVANYITDGAAKALSDLAAPSGSSLVGFQQSGAGASARTVQDRLRDVVSVKDFGAKGDGTTDDTAAVQDAYDYLCNNGGGTLYFPPGNYSVTGISKAYTAGSQSPVSLLGAGKRVSVITKRGTSTAAVFDFSSTVSLLDMYQRVANLSVVGNSGASAHAGFKLTNWAKIIHESVEYRYCDVGVDGYGCLVATFVDCQAISNVRGLRFRKSADNVYSNNITVIGGVVTANTAFGIDYDHGNGISFRGTDIEANGTAGNQSTGGIYIGDNITAEAGLAALSLDNCHIEGNKGWSIQTGASTLGNITVRNTLLIGSESGRAVWVKSCNKITLDNVLAVSPGDTVNLTADYAVILNSQINVLTDTGVSRKFYAGLVTGAGSNNQLSAANTMRAWVRTDGSVASPVVIDGFNVDSISKVSTGIWKINFKNAMPNLNYAVLFGGVVHSDGNWFVESYATTYVQVSYYRASTGYADTNNVSVGVLSGS